MRDQVDGKMGKGEGYITGEWTGGGREDERGNCQEHGGDGGGGVGQDAVDNE